MYTQILWTCRLKQTRESIIGVHSTLKAFFAYFWEMGVVIIKSAKNEEGVFFIRRGGHNEIKIIVGAFAYQ